MSRLFLPFLCAATLLAVAGCDMSGDDQPSRPISQPDPSKDSLRGNRANTDAKVVVVEPFKRNTATGTSDGSAVKPPSQSSDSKPPESTGAAADNLATETSFFGNSDEARGFHAIAGEIADLLKLKKTLVVWLIDQSPGSSAIRTSAAQQIATVGQEAVKKAKAVDGKSNPLSVAIVSFGKEVNVVTPEPVEDLAQAASLASGIAEEQTDNPLTFTAVSKAAEQFLPYRSKGFQLLFVIAANHNGRDYDKLDEVIPKFHKAVVSVFGIGSAVPLGRDARTPADKVPSESLALERIDLAYPGKYSETELVDSGYGPFGLERLCRKTQGRFFRIRFNDTSPGWKTASDGSVDSELLKKHAPDYVSEKEYRQLLSENKARQALVNAAKLPHTDVLDAVRTMRFSRQKDEAALANMVSRAQHDAAEKSLDVDRLYDVLSPGEADRPKLTGARWQAEFDLAMGRILAAKSRIDGYNAILATIKQGKAFANKDSTTWVLNRADGVSGSSVLNKNATSARIYLNRVIEEHPGTPWAAMAEHELMQPVGWELTEE